MTFHFLMIFILLILSSCWNDLPGAKEKKEHDKVQVEQDRSLPVQTADTELRLDPFEKIPATIDGCGEYFTTIDNKAAKDNFIFLSNLTSFALIKVNGLEIYLKRDKTASKEIDTKNYIAVYSGEGYKVILTLNQVIAYDEGGFYNGTLEITRGNKSLKYPVHGESGC
jgi:hypothetical protein